MPFDASFIPEPQIGDARMIHEGLNELAVEYSLISRSFPVARFLSGIFPCLSSITTDRECSDNESAGELAAHAMEIAFHVCGKRSRIRFRNPWRRARKNEFRCFCAP